ARRVGKGSAHPQKLKKRKRRNRIVALLATTLMLTGVAFIGGTYYFTSVRSPGELPLGQITRIFSADGKLIGQLGDDNRTVVKFEEISQPMKDAMVAAEDRTFYKNSGVDFKGMLRAVWNNVSGGDQQGASTLTQQYARIAEGLDQDSSYTRKLKEAVIAMKLSQEYTKDEILGFYLNTVDFGRGTSGIQAAAQAYFGINAKELTAEQSAVIAGMVKSPGGYYEPDDYPERVKERWAYVMDSMVETGAMTQEQRDKAQFPKVKPFQPVGEFWQKPVYQIVKYVKQEMAELKFGDLKTGGYNIYTSIDMRAQAEAEKAAASVEKGNPMRNQDPNITSALVATEPATGRVLAYYGGPDGAGSDFAGYRVTSDDVIEGEGFHPPGSTAKVYVLAAALQKGYGVSSIWDGRSPMDFPKSGRTRANGNPVSNAGNYMPCGNHCTLRQATVNSLNTPFYSVTERVGAGAVLDVMREAGVHHMTPARTAEGQPRPNIDVTKFPIDSLVPSKFQTEIGIGQYDVTPLEHSAGMATFANNGTSVKQHFVTKVTKGNDVLHEDKSTRKKQVVSEDIAAVMADVLQDIHADRGAVRGRQVASKTGTWQVGDGKLADENGDVWISGYSPQVATAVWVGSKKERIPLYVNTNSDLPYSATSHRRQMYGSDLPGSIYKQFMEKVHQALKLPVKSFPQPVPVGDPDMTGNGAAPSAPPAPSASPGGDNCMFPPFCPGRAGDAGNGPARPNPSENEGGAVGPPPATGLPGLVEEDAVAPGQSLVRTLRAGRRARL
nr:penicillin-binding protein [Longispora sp. (in: high G+C Gram-positive bacteria)]